MPQPKNTLLRALIPLLVVLGGLGVAYAVFVNAGRGVQQQQAASATTPAGTSASTPGETPTSTPNTATATTPNTNPAANAAAQPTPQPAAVPSSLPPIAGLRAVPQPGGFVSSPIGSLDDKSDLLLYVEFSEVGAGIRRVQLTREYETIKRDEHVTVQREVEVPGASGGLLKLTPFALQGIEINGTFVNLTIDASGAPLWRALPDGPGQFEALIVDANDAPVAKVLRRYAVAPGTHQITLHQSIANLTAAPINVKWWQVGASDLTDDSHGYGGDKRRLHFGYLLPPASDPGQQFVMSSGHVIPRATVVARGATLPAEARQWPNETSIKNGESLVWTGFTNRYYGAASFPLADINLAPMRKQFDQVAVVDRIVLDQGMIADKQVESIALRLSSPVTPVAPGGILDFSQGILAGPMSKPAIAKEPLLKALGLDGMVVYNFGGPCAFCTFETLTGLLSGLLLFLHNSVVFDWALAVIMLVVIVRTCLHPVTKWSQIRMTRFGKQMQGLAPKQAKLKEKYGSDPKRMQQEMANLWREEGVSPTGALGCIPMFLQMPIWIALYATLFFSVEMRHESAFFGVFQKLGLTTFLADLAEPDRLWVFSEAGVHVPVLSSLMGPIHSLNVLPLLLGVVFFIQQKYLSPPTANLTPEQETQQKMMKWMSVIMFPLFMYNAPAALSIYFTANSTLGILESRYIRSHIDKYDLAAKQKETKPGFFARMQQMAEQQRLAAEKAQRESIKKKR
ncbi:MAG: membrane protein insertase YidC [Planctomycetota bacterium]|nr:membrane protein insertase YidC [Planctomycetota bacterium]